jgi:hypothetical protein
MSLAGTVLAWLALAVGLLQMYLSFIVLFNAGWAMPLFLALLLLPLLPLILTQEVRPWPKPKPIVPAMAAVISMAVSGLVYWLFYNYGD